ncbi:MAG: tellurite resistance TerB family protein [Rubripirellula sp.]
MDAMDVLGALLGKKSGSGSAGGNILKDLLTGGRGKSQPQPRQHPKAQNPRSQTSTRRPRTIGDAAKGLEDLLNVSNDHHQQRRQTPQPKPRQPEPKHEEMNEQAEILIRAMICAAKSDGQITKDEQDDIVKQLGEVSQEEVDFLRAEFAKPVDVREFTWSVPRGMEEQVYSISLMGIDLDEQKEAEYLADLAHGLRLDPARCNQIHQSYGAPVIFQA